MNELQSTTEAPITMSSVELHSAIYQTTGLFPNLGDFHKKIRKVLINQSDAILESANLRNNG